MWHAAARSRVQADANHRARYGESSRRCCADCRRDRHRARGSRRCVRPARETSRRTVRASRTRRYGSRQTAVAREGPAERALLIRGEQRVACCQKASSSPSSAFGNLPTLAGAPTVGAVTGPTTIRTSDVRCTAHECSRSKRHARSCEGKRGLVSEMRKPDTDPASGARSRGLVGLG
jgi:hypothetical protein